MPPPMSERIDNIRASLGPLRKRLHAEYQGDRSTPMWVAVMVADNALREATRQLAVAALTLGIQEDLET